MCDGSPSIDHAGDHERGSAALEFITAGVILLVPLVYLVLSVAGIQAGALAVEGAARQAARVFVQQDTPEHARASAERAVEFVLADYGLSAKAAKVSIMCSPHPGDCLRRNGLVTVSVTATVTLPLVPAAVTVNAPLSVPLHSTATQQVSRFWGAG